MALYNSSGKLLEYVLYDNTTGTNGTVTLSSSSANFTYLEVFFRSNDGTDCQSSVKIYSPNGKKASLNYFYITGTTLYLKSKNISISGTTITSSAYVEATIYAGTPSVSVSNNIYITRVVGYK